MECSDIAFEEDTSIGEAIISASIPEEERGIGVVVPSA